MCNVVSGTDYTGADILAIGDRIYNIEKQFNLLAGVTSDEDTLPKRLLEEEIPEGPSKGWVNKLDEMLGEYYKERGWSEEGIPTKAKLEELGL